MKHGLYPHLAWNSIRNNSKYYIPYIIAGILMVSMFYIMIYLNSSRLIASLHGGSAMRTVFWLGSIVILIFAMIFLFYTNSFLIRVRNRELGLYSILGMTKRNIVSVVACESLIVFALVISGGLLAGISLSRLSELCLFKMIQLTDTSGFRLNSDTVSSVFFVFLFIYGILFLYSVLKVSTSKALELMHGEAYGEKKPKGNFILAIIGLLLLIAAYWMAITITNPVKAVNLFFIAVIMVVIGTYLLFIAASVVLCQILQKNKRYYYQSSHFFSVSTMRFRMKRNGAGLASICILMTMVLVMTSLSTSMFIGNEDSINASFKSDVISDISLTDNPEKNAKLTEESIDYLNQTITGATDIHYYPYLHYQVGKYTNDGFIYNSNSDTMSLNELFVIDLSTYNKITNENRKLKDGECYMLSDDTSASYKTFSFNDEKWKVDENIHNQVVSYGTNVSFKKPVTLVINSLDEIPYGFGEDNPEYMNILFLHYTCNTKTPPADNTVLSTGLLNIFESVDGGANSFNVSVNTKQNAWETTLQLFGGFLVMCVMLSVLFLVAAVIILYYKQISEGFEDQKRFSILKKVGMTRKEIRKSINSQILIMFFMPLLVAGCHLAAAFPMFSKIMMLCGINNLSLSVLVTSVTFLIFAVFYGIVYRLTSNTYFKIVNS